VHYFVYAGEVTESLKPENEGESKVTVKAFGV
jgi:hypothetical protein